MIKKRLLITGAYGLVGSNVCKVLERDYPDIEITKLKCDELGYTFCGNFNYVIHAAGYGQPQLFGKDKIKTININTEYTIGLFTSLRPDGKFLYTLCPSLNDNKDKGEKNACPICEKASALFKTEDKRDEELAHKMYKKQRFFLNILVVEDPRPAAENQKGKVLVYEYGKKVQEKLEDAMVEQKIDIINPLAGHDYEV